MNISEAKEQVKLFKNIQLIAKKLGYFVIEHGSVNYNTNSIDDGYAVTPLKYKNKLDKYFELDDYDNYEIPYPISFYTELEELQNFIFGIAFAKGYRIQDWKTCEMKSFITKIKKIKDLSY